MNVDEFNKLTKRIKVEEKFFDTYILPFYKALTRYDEEGNKVLFPSDKFVKWYDRNSLNRWACQTASDYSNVVQFYVDENIRLRKRVKELEHSLLQGFVTGKIIIKPEENNA